MITRIYHVSVTDGWTTVYADSGNVLSTFNREITIDDMLALLAAPAQPEPIPAPPARGRWLERILIVAITAALVYTCGPTVMWFLTDTSDHHLNFNYGSKP